MVVRVDVRVCMIVRVIMLVGVWYNRVGVGVMALRWKRGRHVGVEMTIEIEK